ncbi:NUC153 domain-containing protein [Cavenderia fasciculata]|uniref:NUC153 domain-containing protein n=1 Tax=Cavenderia fasciculata TaxID=261658 RepID=F4Q506_CACFS|nr:NUC153 domain-containing protein [Cavenderia fasciculata]EGG17112.1 NUC153 domain-containing protein [Cavenderia fasciculata]|eukprot:XP_004355596.1 NUC153 domain-containing protein [Cavenderia fasciculata]
MNLLTTNGVKIYNVSAGKSLPEWLSEKKRDELRKNKEFRSRVELIQDFSFESSSQRVKLTPDGQYLIAAGIYKPQIKIFELSQLSNKVTRHIDSHVVQIEILSQDYSKPVFLRADRYVEFHAKNGCYFTIEFGRGTFHATVPNRPDRH